MADVSEKVIIDAREAFATLERLRASAAVTASALSVAGGAGAGAAAAGMAVAAAAAQVPYPRASFPTAEALAFRTLRPFTTAATIANLTPPPAITEAIMPPVAPLYVRPTDGVASARQAPAQSGRMTRERDARNGSLFEVSRTGVNFGPVELKRSGVGLKSLNQMIGPAAAYLSVTLGSARLAHELGAVAAKVANENPSVTFSALGSQLADTAIETVMSVGRSLAGGATGFFTGLASVGAAATEAVGLVNAGTAARAIEIFADIQARVEGRETEAQIMDRRRAQLRQRQRAAEIALNELSEANGAREQQAIQNAVRGAGFVGAFAGEATLALQQYAATLREQALREAKGNVTFGGAR